MAHVRSYSQRDKDGIFLYSNGNRIGGPYNSEEEATQASKLVSQMVGEAPVEDYIEFLKGPITSTKVKGRPQYTPPNTVSGTNLFGDLKKVGSSILDFVPEDLGTNILDFFITPTSKMADFSRGIRNNNPFNIRKTNIKWDGKIQGKDKEFETFDSDLMGIRAGARNSLTHFRRGLDTVNDLVSEHAPSSENPTQSFVNFVSSKLGVGPNDKINLEDEDVLFDFVNSVIAFENQHYFYDEATVRKAIKMALGI